VKGILQKRKIEDKLLNLFDEGIPDESFADLNIFED